MKGTVEGCERFDEDSGPCAFQAASKYERPGEFLQSMLDLIRIIFEPSPFGTMLLNSNIDFVLDEVVKTVDADRKLSHL